MDKTITLLSFATVFGFLIITPGGSWQYYSIAYRSLKVLLPKGMEFLLFFFLLLIIIISYTHKRTGINTESPSGAYVYMFLGLTTYWLLDNQLGGSAPWKTNSPSLKSC